MYTSADILRQLDVCFRAGLFPELDNPYYHLVDQRLHALRDPERWALVIEVLGYNARAGDLVDAVHVYGNCLDRPPGLENHDFLARLDNADELDEIASDGEAWSRASGIGVRGTLIPVPAAVPDGTPIADLLRAVVPGHRVQFLIDEAELRARVPADLPLLLRLDEWCHPDVAGGVRPSRSPTFAGLAEALASGDARRYVPGLPPNTHWSHWPRAGTL